jgi:hypothetical protein
VARNVVNEIIPRQLYQRGQILTWQRWKKYEMLTEKGIKTVVNFWPKMDPDLAESPVVNYLQLSAVRSEQMLETRMEGAARWVARLAETAPVLVLCEAGKTRSVYFCVLLTSLLLEESLEDALEHVRGRVGAVSLKPGMLRRIARGWPKRKAPLRAGLGHSQEGRPL